MTESSQQAIPDTFISVSIIEDNHYIREGWKASLNHVTDFVVLGAYESCEKAFEAPDIGDSDVVIMDIGLPGMSGIEGVYHLKKRYPDLTIVMCTVHDDDQNVFDALCHGAVGYLLKKTSPEEFKNAIRVAASGGSPMNPVIARKVIASFQQPARTNSDTKEDQLTEREQQVLEELARGKSYREVGEVFHLSLDGVRYYIRSIYEKLHVHSRSEAVAKGLKKRLIR